MQLPRLGRNSESNGALNHEQSRERDRLLLARLRTGDESSFEALFDIYYASLVRFARALLGAMPTAEETVQDVFFDLWRRRSTIRIELSLRAYLFQAVRFRASNERRRLRLETSVGGEIIREFGIAASTSRDHAAGDAAERELRAVLTRVLAALPPRPRQVFLLNRRDELSYAEVAEVLKISLKTVEMHMTRALMELRQGLREWRDR